MALIIAAGDEGVKRRKQAVRSLDDRERGEVTQGVGQAGNAGCRSSFETQRPAGSFFELQHLGVVASFAHRQVREATKGREITGMGHRNRFPR
jgi:hypothetical protein